MNENIVIYLKLLKEYDLYHNIKSNYVACTTVGTMHVPRNIARSLTLLCGRAGITSNIVYDFLSKRIFCRNLPSSNASR